MDKALGHTLLVILAAAVLSSCSDILGLDYTNPRTRHGQGEGTGSRNETETRVRTLLLYSAGYNNLSPVLKDDIDDICTGYLPEGYSFNDNLLVFAHHSVSKYNFSDEVQPCLIRIYRDRDGIAVRDTVRTWPEGTSAVDPETLRSVLEYVRDNYPSEEYGMIFSSHATGWLPPNFPRNGSTILMSGGSGTGNGQERSIGQDAGTGEEMDVKDFAAAIPMELEYLIFDACLTGGVEVAYELKDVCRHLVFSSEEILADGMVYTDIIYRLLGTEPSDITGVAEDYFNHYNSLSGMEQSALISVIDCSGLEELAQAAGEIFSRHAGQIPAIDASEVQKLNYASRWFYDFRDIMAQLTDGQDDVDGLDAALGKCVMYKANTEYFMGSRLKIDTFCGLSMYLPSAVLSESTMYSLNEYYRGFKWNQATGYISDFMISGATVTE